MSPLQKFLPEGEAWSERWWGVIQAAILALVGYLALQAISTQTSLSAMVTEHRYTNMRLEKIEVQLEKSTATFATKEEGLRQLMQIEKALSSFESRLNTQATAIQDLRTRTGRDK